MCPDGHIHPGQAAGQILAPHCYDAIGEGKQPFLYTRQQQQQLVVTQLRKREFDVRKTVGTEKDKTTLEG